MASIQNIEGFELLDSRGYPTVAARVTLDTGESGFAMVPSGASTGEKERLELRDGKRNRYHGKGVMLAVGNINKKIRKVLIDADVTNQQDIDQTMLDLDGTENKTKLGANAILAVFISLCKSRCRSKRLASIPLYWWRRPLYYASTAYEYYQRWRTCH